MEKCLIIHWILYHDKKNKDPAGSRVRAQKEPRTSATSRPPTADAAVLWAMAGLTSEFGMGSGDPRLRGRARAGLSPRGRHRATLTAAKRTRHDRTSTLPKRVLGEELGRLVPLA